MNQNDDDKRVNPRFGPLAIKATFVVSGQKREGYLTNVSLGGAFLAVDDPPSLGVEIDLSAFLPWRLGELRGSAQVVWRNPDGAEPPSLPGVGLAFTRMEAEGKHLLEAYLARFVELAARIDEEE